MFAHTGISINAPIATVWAVMMDLESYSDWNPFIERAVRRGAPAPAVGDKLTLYVRFRGGKLVASPERITVITPPSPNGTALLEYEFYGWLHLTGMIRGSRLQRLRQEPDGTTSYETEERFRGMMARWTPVRSVQDGFERHAAALKQRAETQASALSR